MVHEDNGLPSVTVYQDNVAIDKETVSTNSTGSVSVVTTECGDPPPPEMVAPVMAAPDLPSNDVPWSYVAPSITQVANAATPLTPPAIAATVLSQAAIAAAPLTQAANAASPTLTCTARWGQEQTAACSADSTQNAVSSRASLCPALPLIQELGAFYAATSTVARAKAGAATPSVAAVTSLAAMAIPAATPATTSAIPAATPATTSAIPSVTSASPAVTSATPAVVSASTNAALVPDPSILSTPITATLCPYTALPSSLVASPFVPIAPTLQEERIPSLREAVAPTLSYSSLEQATSLEQTLLWAQIHSPDFYQDLRKFQSLMQGFSERSEEEPKCLDKPQLGNEVVAARTKPILGKAVAQIKQSQDHGQTQSQRGSQVQSPVPNQAPSKVQRHVQVHVPNQASSKVQWHVQVHVPNQVPSKVQGHVPSQVQGYVQSQARSITSNKRCSGVCNGITSTALAKSSATRTTGGQGDFTSLSLAQIPVRGETNGEVTGLELVKSLVYPGVTKRNSWLPGLDYGENLSFLSSLHYSYQQYLSYDCEAKISRLTARPTVVNIFSPTSAYHPYGYVCCGSSYPIEPERGSKGPGQGQAPVAYQARAMAKAQVQARANALARVQPQAQALARVQAQANALARIQAQANTQARGQSQTKDHSQSQPQSSTLFSAITTVAAPVSASDIAPLSAAVSLAPTTAEGANYSLSSSSLSSSSCAKPLSPQQLKADRAATLANFAKAFTNASLSVAPRSHAAATMLVAPSCVKLKSASAALALPPQLSGSQEPVLPPLSDLPESALPLQNSGVQELARTQLLSAHRQAKLQQTAEVMPLAHLASPCPFNDQKERPRIRAQISEFQLHGMQHKLEDVMMESSLPNPLNLSVTSPTGKGHPVRERLTKLQPGQRLAKTNQTKVLPQKEASASVQTSASVQAESKPLASANRVPMLMSVTREKKSCALTPKSMVMPLYMKAIKHWHY